MVETGTGQAQQQFWLRQLLKIWRIDHTNVNHLRLWRRCDSTVVAQHGSHQRATLTCLYHTSIFTLYYNDRYMPPRSLGCCRPLRKYILDLNRGPVEVESERNEKFRNCYHTVHAWHRAWQPAACMAICLHDSPAPKAPVSTRSVTRPSDTCMQLRSRSLASCRPWHVWPRPTTAYTNA